MPAKPLHIDSYVATHTSGHQIDLLGMFYASTPVLVLLQDPFPYGEWDLQNETCNWLNTSLLNLVSYST